MFLSVIRTTKAPVKFWLLKNYLSPTLKEILPAMAQKYNFEFEYVQYKWPRWLNQQTEKQRIIWGYKILFLDVMFPLDVKKIIFVDTDQIVRADLTELRDMDLKGAPYGLVLFFLVKILQAVFLVISIHYILSISIEFENRESTIYDPIHFQIHSLL